MSVQSQPMPGGGARTGVMVAETELHGGALSFPQVIAQAFTHIAPGIALLLAGSFIAAQVGFNMPLAYLFGAVICLAIAITLATLAAEFPAAASYFTYVSKTIHPRAGFLVGWLYMLYDPITGAICATIFGTVLENQAKAAWNVDIPWWLTFAIMLVVATWITWRGIKISGRVVLTLAIIEIAILTLFGLSGLLSPGPVASLPSPSPGSTPRTASTAWPSAWPCRSWPSPGSRLRCPSARRVATPGATCPGRSSARSSSPPGSWSSPRSAS